MHPRSIAAAGALSIGLCSWLAQVAPGAGAEPPRAPSLPHRSPPRHLDARSDAKPAAAAARADLFTTSEQCGICHMTAPGANAMRTRTGDDVSPYALWQGTMMANSFRDPYFQAKLQHETAHAGPGVQELCLRCHAPMSSHGAVLAGGKPPRLADLTGDVFADDGVSCTVCHQIDAANLGAASSFSGRPTFGTERRIFGPFADVTTGPMQNLVRYTPTQGLHVRESALCGTCHTLFVATHGEADTVAEQTPYLEWRNSEFSDEHGARSATSRTCQECHMPQTGATRIARSPTGFDFDVPVREGYAAHAFVGGNAFVLDMLDDHREDLGVLAEPLALERMAAATRRQLGESTAKVSISRLARQDGAASFTVRVENLTGHKLPTAYPSRRAWLHVQVRAGRQLVFETGAVDAAGRLAGVTDELALPHVRTVTAPGDVVVYEMVPADETGAATTLLTRMTGRLKDNRLLPRGWRSDGPHAADTAPVGTDGDGDFTAGGDTVAFRIPLPAKARGRLQVTVRMYYQPVPPAWVDPLRTVASEECARFVRMYDAARKTPDVVAFAARTER